MSAPVIIGGGPAGAAAAITLARAGRPVTLIERSIRDDDKVCGDFISAEAIAMLDTLGVDLAASQPINAVRLIHRGRFACAPLPFAARSLTRRALDAALLRQAALRGVTVLRGHRIGAVRQDGDALRLECRTLEPIAAQTVFLATGKHELRGTTRRARVAGMLGLKMYFRLAAGQMAALRQHVELVLFAGGYAGLQPVEADRAVLCMLLPAARMQAIGGRWDDLLGSLMAECPHLRARLAGATPLLERPLAVAGLPYGFVHAANRDDPPGLFRLGDQMAVIASLTGDGVALALASGSTAAQVWLSGDNAGEYHRRYAAAIARQMRVARGVHRVCLIPWLQPWLVASARQWPPLMRHVAAATRMR